MSDAFYFDDFLVAADDPGIKITLTIRGRVVPMRVKRDVSFADRERAKANAVKFKLNRPPELTHMWTSDGWSSSGVGPGNMGIGRIAARGPTDRYLALSSRT
jgi:hypothetical protein